MIPKAFALVFALALLVGPVWAEEQKDKQTTPKAPAAEPAKPADAQPKVTDEKAGACKPDGSCCGSTACKQAGGETNTAAGGCPCSKRKQM